MDILYITHLLNGLLMIAMPLALAIYLTRTWKLAWRFWLVGGAVFILSQVGHIPFNALVGNLLNQTGMVSWPKSAQTLFNALFLGLSAGLFEELARYAMFRWWLKDARSWRTGVLTGAGHGGFEAIVLGLLVLFAYVQLVALRDPAVVAALPPEQVELVKAQVAEYWSTPWYASLLGALERFFTIPVQIAFSVIVLQTFTRKQGFWVWLAVLYHAIVDAVAVLSVSALGIYWTEAIVCGFSILSVIIIFSLRQTDPDSPEPAPVSTTETAPDEHSVAE